MMMMTKSLLNTRWEDICVYEDDQYAVMNKPHGLATLEDRASPINVLKIVREKYPAATPCHRLDKETSGVLVVAKTDDAYKYFAGKLEARQIKKVYHAVVNGIQSFQNFEAGEPLFSSGSKTRVDRAGKQSLTLVQTLEVFKKHTLLKCFPVTGRMHQIRVHLAYHGASIVHDPLYGGNSAYLSELKKNFNQKKHEDENPMIRRLALHAFSITFDHPQTGETVEIEAPYPKDFEVLVKQLRKFS